jgi:hypothetical protein
MEQLGIDFNQAPRARTSNAATSHAAAARVREFDGEHYAKILVLELGEAARDLYWIQPAGAYEARDNPRDSRALQALPPRALPTDETRPSPRGRPCRVWARR